ncbi:hypothetical protein CVIRNUC_005449 [Coccomyxa viridis]|uniref:PDZ domain-containing protein n=1 Tax=Coccomyxa viridis TaxID=1274662 RepID=A0AAV1I630_9CHLO|nr:hypothetical protein CVIRNUC_005449 [Coccomyxa viridis]
MGAPDDETMALKVQLKDLLLKRENIEGDIALRAERLEVSGVGRTGSLVDKEGFPRADVDIASIRTDRRRLTELTNDHKALTKAMDQLLQQLHATQKPQNGHAQPHTPSSSRPAQRSEAIVEPAAPSASQLAHSRPFAKIDEVSEHSPASTAGLQVGDLLVGIGDVFLADSSPQEAMAQVASTVRRSRDTELVVLVLRRGLEVTVQLKPSMWAGAGLLGCHIVPLH